jgi:tRNA (guanine10-N2)-methyltransferase
MDHASREGYIAPKKAYSFDALIEDILDFAALALVDGGRIAMWLPTANDQDIEIAIPQHHCFKLVSVCLQEFNKCGLLRKLIFPKMLSANND